MIHVCSLARLAETVTISRAEHVVSLISQGTPVLRPETIAQERHLLLSMHDIVDELEDMTPPGQSHVEDLLTFARAWGRARPLVIHCFAGISRSTAAAYVVAAALAPHRDERELARALRLASPSATPNPRLVAVADEILGRDGRMVSAIREIGRGADAYEGKPFVLPIDRA